MEVRQGKRDPIPFPEDIEASKRKLIKEENELVKSLSLEIEAKEKELKTLNSKLQFIDKKYLSGTKALQSEKAEINKEKQRNSFEGKWQGDGQILGKLNTAISELNNKIEDLSPLYQEGIKIQKPIRKAIKRIELEIFKLRNQISSIMIAQLKKDSKGLLGIKELRKLNEYEITYPFDNPITSDYFDALGGLRRPFTCYIYGAKETGKTLIGVNLCAALIENFESKILYAADIRQMNKGLYHIITERIKSDLITVCEAENKTSIDSALEKDNFEFLFIDSCNRLKIAYSAIISIKKKFPRLSIFCISDKLSTDLKVNADSTFEVREGAAELVEGKGNKNFILRAWPEADFWLDMEGHEYT